MQAQRSTRKTRQAAPVQAPRPEYIAAVRYPDGQRDVFHIRNADSLEDARELVQLEVGDALSIVVALRH